METAPKFILLGSWGLFFLVWTVMYFSAKKDVYAQPTGEREMYSLPFTASIAILLLAQHGPLGPDEGMRAMFARLVPMTPGLGWASAAVALVSVALAIWARLALGHNWSAVVALKDGHELVTDGPYRLVRHPIYTALIGLVLASVTANRTGMGLASLALTILSCWIKLRAEEGLMLQQFPERYPAYMARTKRLVPWLV